ncbi:MAG: PH domain-containing protein [Clostridia bacterium]|nr:PH domain-containing protein [Clostridia bacterium]
MKENTLPKKTTWLWFVRVILITFILVAICLYFTPLFSFLKIAAIVIGILGIIIAFLYLPFFFKTYKIILSNDAVIVKYGIFIKAEHIMPYKRMIYAQSFETPLARLWGVAAVRLKAARSYLLVAEIEKESARSIIDFLAEGESHE